MGQNQQEMGHPDVETRQPAFRRAHGTQLIVTTRRKGQKIAIPCPRCRRRALERFWHADLELGICDRCWSELATKSIPMAL